MVGKVTEPENFLSGKNCSQCQNTVTGESSSLSWQLMEFCNEQCLFEYQNKVGVKCAHCQVPVESSSIGTYSIRLGYNPVQFCSSKCMESAKRVTTLCTFCLETITGKDNYLAPVEGKLDLQEFCKERCNEEYIAMLNKCIVPFGGPNKTCDICVSKAPITVEYIEAGKVNAFCNELCFLVYKCNHNVSPAMCDRCYKYFPPAVLEEHSVYVDNVYSRFCSKLCLNVYVMMNKKHIRCPWCKVLKNTFDMIFQRHSESNRLMKLCSLYCLNLYKTTHISNYKKVLPCESCKRHLRVLCHVKTSDQMIYNFCSYNCVIAFYIECSAEIETEDAGAIALPLAASAGASTDDKPRSSRKRRRGKRKFGSRRKNNKNQNSPVRENTPPPSNTAIVPKPKIRYQLIVKGKSPPPQRNIATMCKPLIFHKASTSRIRMNSVEVQTDNYEESTLLMPFPVPFFVPVPVMYSTIPIPVPIPFPLFVPTPLFIPTTKTVGRALMGEVENVQTNMPTDTLQGEIVEIANFITLGDNEDYDSNECEEGHLDPDTETAVLVPYDDSGEVCVIVPYDDADDACILVPYDGTDDACILVPYEDTDEASCVIVPYDATVEESAVVPYVGSAEQSELVPYDGSIEESVLLSYDSSDEASNSFNEDSTVAEEISSASVIHLTQIVSSNSPEPDQACSRVLSKTTYKRIVGTTRFVPEQPLASNEESSIETKESLKPLLGVNAFRQWLYLKSRNMDTNSRSYKLFNTDILDMTAEEINYCLVLFLKELRKLNRQRYTPDTVYYLCLGIQKYLYDNGRVDDLFHGVFYKQFQESLDGYAKSFITMFNRSKYIITRVEERQLWESRQLGSHSPYVLLTTLIYFNTKFFNLWTVRQHMELSFAHIIKHWKRSSYLKGSIPSRNVLLRYYSPSALENPTRKRIVPEQHENKDDPSMCPIQIYEFYLSKCIDIKNRTGPFYLTPETCCSPDSPYWFTGVALDLHSLEKILHLIRMVKEINISMMSK